MSLDSLRVVFLGRCLARAERDDLLLGALFIFQLLLHLVQLPIEELIVRCKLTHFKLLQLTCFRQLGKFILFVCQLLLQLCRLSPQLFN